MNKSFVELENISMTYNTRQEKVEALADISLSVQHGEFVSIVGPSGCGKSTMLLITAGLLRPSAGKVRINGTEVTKPYTDVGIVFQSPVLLDWRNTLKNVLLQIEMRRLNPEDYRERALQLIESVGLAGFEDKHPYELSGGMQQRAAICRALIHDPPLLLMDEPFGALDALTREQMRIDIEQLLSTTDVTVIFVTHSIAEAVQLSDRVVVLSPRPGVIERIFEVDLPRPRRREVQESSEFIHYTREITEIFMARGVLHE